MGVLGTGHLKEGWSLPAAKGRTVCFGYPTGNSSKEGRKDLSVSSISLGSCLMKRGKARVSSMDKGLEVGWHA